ncbi:MAG: hypothetical protein RL669_78 [Pseudomonadota bacterium]
MKHAVEHLHSVGIDGRAGGGALALFLRGMPQPPVKRERAR